MKLSVLKLLRLLCRIRTRLRLCCFVTGATLTASNRHDGDTTPQK